MCATGDIVEEIKQSLYGKQYIIQQIMREYKKLAKYVANMAIEKGSCTF